MGVYSLMRPDVDILRDVAGFKSAVILGCTSCANVSIAYVKELPLSRILLDEKTKQTKKLPVAIVEEANRLKALFEKNGIDTKVELCYAPCNYYEEKELDESEIFRRCNESDSVVLLSCSAGFLGVRNRLRRNVKLFTGMKTFGLHQIHSITDHEKGLVYIDKDRTVMFRTGKP